MQPQRNGGAVRRQPGTGSLFIRADKAGRETWYDQDRPAGRLRVGVGHRQPGSLLEREDIAEVFGEPIEEGQIVGIRTLGRLSKADCPA